MEGEVLISGPFLLCVPPLVEMGRPPGLYPDSQIRCLESLHMT